MEKGRDSGCETRHLVMHALSCSMLVRCRVADACISEQCAHAVLESNIAPCVRLDVGCLGLFGFGGASSVRGESERSRHEGLSS